MEIERKKIKLSRLVQNTGKQIEGLPCNPRTWTQADLDGLVASIRETPELIEAGALKVTPLEDGNYVILGGNMRYDALVKLGYSEVPCAVFPLALGVDKLKEIVIKDNGSFGKWDWDSMANEWSDLPLKDWGVEASFLSDDNWDELPQVENNPAAPVTAQKITVTVPSSYTDNLEDIKAAVRLTVAEWEGCEVK